MKRTPSASTSPHIRSPSTPGAVERYAVNRNSELAELEDGAQVVVGGMISSIKLATAKKPSRNNHTRYANFDLEDPSGIIRCIAWPEDYARYEDVIKSENVVIVSGKVDRRSREPNLIVNRIHTLDQADREFTAQIAIRFEKGLHSPAEIQRVRGLLSRFPGNTDVVLLVDSWAEDSRKKAGAEMSAADMTASARLRYVLTTGTDCRVNIGPEFLQALTDIVGESNYDLKAAKTRKPAGQGIGR
jgi:DNA polymerase-3 subunit alpha